MNDFPLHPKLVHLPIALAVLMPLLTSGLLLAWWRGWFRPRTWTLAVAAQALLFASGLVAMWTGEADEERVEHLVPEAAIEAHEESAEAFVWGAGVLLALSLLPLLLRRRGAAQVAGVVSVVGSLAVLGLGIRVGQAGGELVYRHGAAAAYTAPAGDGAAVRARSDDDHDER